MVFNVDKFWNVDLIFCFLSLLVVILILVVILRILFVKCIGGEVILGMDLFEGGVDLIFSFIGGLEFCFWGKILEFFLRIFLVWFSVSFCLLRVWDFVVRLIKIFCLDLVILIFVVGGGGISFLLFLFDKICFFGNDIRVGFFLSFEVEFIRLGVFVENFLVLGSNFVVSFFLDLIFCGFLFNRFGILFDKFLFIIVLFSFKFFEVLLSVFRRLGVEAYVVDLDSGLSVRVLVFCFLFSLLRLVMDVFLLSLFSSFLRFVDSRVCEFVVCFLYEELWEWDRGFSFFFFLRLIESVFGFDFLVGRFLEDELLLLLVRVFFGIKLNRLLIFFLILYFLILLGIFNYNIDFK